MTTLDLLTRLAEVAKDPPGTPAHSVPSWLHELQRRLLVVWDGGSVMVDGEYEQVRPMAYKLTEAGELALEAWRMPPPAWPSAH